MAQTPYVTLNRVNLTWPDGHVLFDDVSESFDDAIVGIVGRNGSGKSTLGALIAGDLAPTRGRVERRAAVRRVTQQVADAADGSIAALAGLSAPLHALQRLNRGDGTRADLDCLGERWDLESRWRQLLGRAGIEHDDDDAASLSGGQRMLVALLGAFCSDADLLVLDEPGNHLDLERGALLREEIRSWRARGRGLVLISHDRDLLARVDRIIDLRHDGLHRHGGGWDSFEHQRQLELESAQTRLAQARHVRDRTLDALRKQRESAERRNARGKRERDTGSQSTLLLNIQRERADHSDAARQERHARQQEEAQRQVAAAHAALGDERNSPVFPMLDIDLPAGQTLLTCERLIPPWGWSEPLDWVVRGPARIAIAGANGTGKSTLLRLLAGHLAPRSGRCTTAQPVALLDQSLNLLDPSRSLLAQLQDRAPELGEAKARRWLAMAGIDATEALRPSATLSGGERLRGALLLAIGTTPAPRLLMLDEPGNHLDLAAIGALEAMLRSWRGALLVASHDRRFLDRIALDGQLARTGSGWTFTPAAPRGD